MTDKPSRIVDAHVHLWDPARSDWYPYLAGKQQLDMGDTTGMNRRFTRETHAAEAAGWNIDKVVNVAAATGRHSIAETIELDREGVADAFIGGLPPTDSVAEAIGLIDEQMAAERFRGVRPMGQFAEPLPAPEVLRELADRELVFEIMSHPDQLAAAARGLAGHEELTVVVEHTGWPRSTADEERTLWEAGIAALAAAGPNVVCKLSGLAMPLQSMDPDDYRPWVYPVIDAFGPDRCLFASNFPVDGLHGTLDQLLTTYNELTAGFDGRTREAIFATTAERVYRL